MRRPIATALLLVALAAPAGAGSSGGISGGGAGASPGGDTGQCQYNADGEFEGAAGCNYDPETEGLTITGPVVSGPGFQALGLAGTYQDRTVQIGVNAHAGNNYGAWGSVAIGWDTDACSAGTTNSCIAIGTDAHATTNSTLALGRQVTSSAGYATAIGFSNTTAEGGSSLAIGDGVHATANSSIAFGVNSTGSGYGSAAFGTGSVCAHTSSWCVGNSAESTAANQLILGGTKVDQTGREDTFKDVFVGAGVTNANPLFDLTVHGTGAVGTDTAAKDFIIAPGRATGNAASGEFVVKTGAVGSSGTTAQTLVERLRVSKEGVVKLTCLASPPISCAAGANIGVVYVDCTDGAFCSCNGSAWTATPLTGSCS